MAEAEDRDTDVPEGVDPDLAGIVAGPQPIRYDDDLPDPDPR